MIEAKTRVTKPAIDTLHSLPTDKVNRFKSIAQKHGVNVTDVAQPVSNMNFTTKNTNAWQQTLFGLVKQ